MAQNLIYRHFQNASNKQSMHAFKSLPIMLALYILIITYVMLKIMLANNWSRINAHSPI